MKGAVTETLSEHKGVINTTDPRAGKLIRRGSSTGSHCCCCSGHSPADQQSCSCARSQPQLPPVLASSKVAVLGLAEVHRGWSLPPSFSPLLSERASAKDNAAGLLNHMQLMEVNLIKSQPGLSCAHFGDFEKSRGLATEFQSPASTEAAARSLTNTPGTSTDALTSLPPYSSEVHPGSSEPRMN